MYPKSNNFSFRIFYIISMLLTFLLLQPFFSFSIFNRRPQSSHFPSLKNCSINIQFVLVIGRRSSAISVVFTKLISTDAEPEITNLKEFTIVSAHATSLRGSFIFPSKQVIVPSIPCCPHKNTCELCISFLNR